MRNIFRTYLVVFLIPFQAAFYAVGANMDDRYDDWMKTFYRTQDVSKFDGFWKNALAEHRLKDVKQLSFMSGFVSQVLHQHPELLKGNFDNLEQCSETEQSVILSVLSLSNTKESDAILKADNGTKYLNQPHLPINGHLITSRSDLAFCWGYYFATGSTDALVPIVSALDNVKYAGSIERYKTTDRTDEDFENAYREGIFIGARSSLAINAKTDPQVAQFLDKVYRDSSTPIPRRRCLRPILPSLFPNRYELIEPTERMTMVVFRNVTQGVDSNSFAAKPKVLYRYGKTIGRIEEMPDPTMNLKALTIANGPDIFIMNLWSKTGLHVIDQSPTCFFKAPIVLQAPLFPPSEKEKMVASISFEIGREMTYMEGKGIKPVPGSFRGRDADLYRSDANGLTLTLYTEPKASLPIGVSVFDGKTELVTITYDEYDSNLPADRSLFWPPPGVQLSIKK